MADNTTESMIVVRCQVSYFQPISLREPAIFGIWLY